MEATTKALINGYIQKAERKLEVAERLFKSGDFEDAAQALLLTEGEHAETHKGVVTLFGLLFVKTGKFSKIFGKYLANLKDDRESGDYEVFSYIDEETAEMALNEAKEFLHETRVYMERSGLIS